MTNQPLYTVTIHLDGVQERIMSLAFTDYPTAVFAYEEIYKAMCKVKSNRMKFSKPVIIIHHFGKIIIQPVYIKIVELYNTKNYSDWCIQNGLMQKSIDKAVENSGPVGFKT